MMYFGAVCVILIIVLIAALTICISTIKQKNTERRELENALDSARTEIRRLGEFMKKKEDIQTDAQAKKDSLHTGDDNTDFNNSLKLLHGSTGRGDKANTPGP
jgi:uncharacterized protein YoxC